MRCVNNEMHSTRPLKNEFINITDIMHLSSLRLPGYCQQRSQCQWSVLCEAGEGHRPVPGLLWDRHLWSGLHCDSEGGFHLPLYWTVPIVHIKPWRNSDVDGTLDGIEEPVCLFLCKLLSTAWVSCLTLHVIEAGAQINLHQHISFFSPQWKYWAAYWNY